jgi:hypothetical protein
MLEYLIDDIIDENEGYPFNDIVEVDFDANFVIMRKEYFDYVKKYIEDLFIMKEIVTDE